MKISIKFSIVFLLLIISISVFYFYQPPAKVQKPINMGAVHLAGDYQLQIKLNPKKPKTGNNQLTLLILDSKNQPVTNATILAYVEMPAMGSMQAMRVAISIENTGSGIYQGQYTLPMNGIWPLTLTIESANLNKAELSFDMSTSRTGLKLTKATRSQHSPKPDEPATAKSQELASFTVDTYRRQLIGVTTTEVICQHLVKTIQVDARVAYDETRLTDISLKYDAWIGQLNADYLGKTIQQGETLFTVYSPDLVSVQNEYLDSLKQTHSHGLRIATRKRLALWDITSAQIKSLRKRGKAKDYLAILSPVNGTIIEKHMVAGSAVKAGMRLLRLADLSTVWIEGEIYESDFPWVKVGMEVQISLPEQPEHAYTSKITFVDSVLNPLTRSAVIRVQLMNTDGVLRPNMFANMKLKIDLGERLVVPEQAVIYSGEQRVVFIDKGNGRLLPTKINTGLRNEDLIEVLDGIEPGDVIVTSGNFLIAAESKFKAGLAQW